MKTEFPFPCAALACHDPMHCLVQTSGLEAYAQCLTLDRAAHDRSRREAR
jgi:hypothetical protein